MADEQVKKIRMPDLMESIFDIVYLSFDLIAGMIFLIYANGRELFILYGVLTLILCGGDAFHLIPRVIRALKGTNERIKKQLGIGLQVSSITMTIFYVLLMYIWKRTFPDIKAPLVVDIIVWVSALIRIVICLLPQNNWCTDTGNKKLSLIRNGVFAITGIGVIILYAISGNANDYHMTRMVTAIIISFGCYLPVTIWSKKHPKIGMLMIPKTCAYIWMIAMGLQLLTTNIDDKADELVNENVMEVQEEVYDKMITAMKGLKTRGNTNPIISQDFGADPYAMVYGDTVYFYMTDDTYELNSAKEVVDNTYSRIDTIRVVSTKDMKNFTDHGLIPVAGTEGIAKWAKNSWAPAACWKNIDGEDKFFLYFADNGGGIGVLEAPSPIGPFRDPLGHGLITRDMEGCRDVLWLFDPAVLVDDDGTGYIYFGGGVPEGKVAHPGTARCARLSSDMIGIDGDIVAIDAPYIFEDSGIHKYNDKYYYSYCTNWNVDSEGTSQYGFTNAEIAVMESESPLGPFEYKETVLNNPGQLCGLYGNNHHCIFEFQDQWYITYHSRALEKSLGVEKGYRNTCIDAFEMGADGTIGKIKQTYEGPKQIISVNPYETNLATCVTAMAGCDSVNALFALDNAESIIYSNSGDMSVALGTNYSFGGAGYSSSEKYNLYGDMVLGLIREGGYTEVDGVDFGVSAPSSVKIRANVPAGTTAKIHVRLDLVNSEDVAVVSLDGQGTYNEYSADIKESLRDKVVGEHFLFFIFEGEGYTVSEWRFE